MGLWGKVGFQGFVGLELGGLGFCGFRAWGFRVLWV